MTLISKIFILELIAWNSFVPSMSLVSFRLLDNENCKNRLYFTLHLASRKVGTKFTTQLQQIPWTLWPYYQYNFRLPSACILITTPQITPCITICVSSGPIILLFVVKILFVFEVLYIKEGGLYDIIIYKHHKSSYRILPFFS